MKYSVLVRTSGMTRTQSIEARHKKLAEGWNAREKEIAHMSKSSEPKRKPIYRKEERYYVINPFTKAKKYLSPIEAKEWKKKECIAVYTEEII